MALVNKTPTYDICLLGAALSRHICIVKEPVQPGDKDFTLRTLLDSELKMPANGRHPTVKKDYGMVDASALNANIMLEEFIAPGRDRLTWHDPEYGIYVSEHLKRVVVAFRHTENPLKEKDVRDMLGTNAQFVGVPIGDRSDDVHSEVHKGFRDAYFNSKVLESVESKVAELYNQHSDNGNDPDWGVLITGHSLGGAMATVCVYRLAVRDMGELRSRGVPIEMVNFGAPRVGNAAFKEELEKSPEEGSRAALLRVVNNNDWGPRLPPTWFGIFPFVPHYCHVGPFVLFDKWANATFYRENQIRELRPVIVLFQWLRRLTSEDDHAMSRPVKDGEVRNAYINKIVALGAERWPGNPAGGFLRRIRPW